MDLVSLQVIQGAGCDLWMPVPKATSETTEHSGRHFGSVGLSLTLSRRKRYDVVNPLTNHSQSFFFLDLDWASKSAHATGMICNPQIL